VTHLYVTHTKYVAVCANPYLTHTICDSFICGFVTHLYVTHKVASEGVCARAKMYVLVKGGGGAREGEGGSLTGVLS